MSNIETNSTTKNWCNEIDDCDDTDLCIYEIKRDRNNEEINNIFYEIDADDKIYDKEKFVVEKKAEK